MLAHKFDEIGTELAIADAQAFFEDLVRKQIPRHELLAHALKLFHESDPQHPKRRALTRGELDTLTADVANVVTISALDDKDGRTIPYGTQQCPRFQ